MYYMILSRTSKRGELSEQVKNHEQPYPNVAESNRTTGETFVCSTNRFQNQTRYNKVHYS